MACVTRQVRRGGFETTAAVAASLALALAGLASGFGTLQPWMECSDTGCGSGSGFFVLVGPDDGMFLMAPALLVALAAGIILQRSGEA